MVHWPKLVLISVYFGKIALACGPWNWIFCQSCDGVMVLVCSYKFLFVPESMAWKVQYLTIECVPRSFVVQKLEKKNYKGKYLRITLCSTLHQKYIKLFFSSHHSHEIYKIYYFFTFLLTLFWGFYRILTKWLFCPWM